MSRDCFNGALVEEIKRGLVEFRRSCQWFGDFRWRNEFKVNFVVVDRGLLRRGRQLNLMSRISLDV